MWGIYCIDSRTFYSVSITSADNGKNVNDAGNKDGAVVGQQVDAWTAHKTETGIVYYYNALTGESTYVKPEGFNREV